MNNAQKRRRKAYQKSYQKAYRQRNEVKAHRKAYMAALRQDPKYRTLAHEYQRAYRQTPEHKARRKAWSKAYRQTPEGVAYQEFLQKIRRQAMQKVQQQEKPVEELGLSARTMSDLSFIGVSTVRELTGVHWVFTQATTTKCRGYVNRHSPGIGYRNRNGYDVKIPGMGAATLVEICNALNLLMK